MSKYCVVIAAILATSAFAAAGTKCTPSETFEARGVFRAQNGPDGFEGDYGWANDVAAMKAVTFARAHEDRWRHYDSWALEDFSAKKIYFEDSVNQTCITAPLNYTEAIRPFAWLDSATFLGRRNFRGIEMDFWGMRYPGGEVSMGCIDNHPTLPVAFFTKNGNSATEVYFTRWRSTIENTTIFRPLPNCS